MSVFLRQEVSSKLRELAPPSDNDNIKSRKQKAQRITGFSESRVHELWYQRVDPTHEEIIAVRNLTRQEKRDAQLIPRLGSLLETLNQGDNEFHVLDIDAIRDVVTRARNALAPQGGEMT